VLPEWSIRLSQLGMDVRSTNPALANGILSPVAERTDRFLRRTVDLGLAGIVFVAPLVMGGRHPIGRLVFVLMVCTVAVAWVCRQCLANSGRWRRSGAEWIVLAGFVLILVQLMPLSQAALARWSPSISEMLPLWTSQGDNAVGLDAWFQISLTPTATRGGLVMFLAYAMLFLVVLQRIECLDDIERLLRWIAIAVVAMAALGIVQLLFGNGKYLWTYAHPFRDTFREVKGTFSNENHFASFLALGIGPLIWWLQRVRRQRDSSSSRNTPSAQGMLKPMRGARRRGALGVSDRHDRFRVLALGLGLGIVAFAGLLTLSRGGVTVIFLASVVSVLLYARAALLERKAVFVLLGVGALVGAALFVYGSESLMPELKSIGAASIDDLDHNFSRRKLWAADAQAVRDFPIVGTGAGSHAEVYPTYYEDHATVEYTHAESGYVQIVLESGTAGLLLLLTGIGLCGYWCVGALRRSKSSDTTACVIAIAAGLSVSIIHSIWDFVWYIPACMSITLILMACGCRLHQLCLARAGSSDARWGTIAITRTGWVAATACVLVLCTVMIKNRLAPALAAPHWERYLKQVIALREQEDGTNQEATIAGMIRNLEKTLERDPNNPRAHSRLANLYVRHFDQRQRLAANPVALIHLRNAALDSQFPSREAQDQWLGAAIGENRRFLDKALRHVRRALHLCPLQGESYVDLAELAFLEGRGRQATQACIEQALRVRPHSGAVQFAVGREAALRGDVTGALKFWKRAFRQDPRYRAQILELLAMHMPASFFLEEFAPDTSGMEQLYAYYLKIQRDDQACEVGRHYAGALEREAENNTGKLAARSLYRAFKVYVFLEEPLRSLDCLKRAAQKAPEDYSIHQELAIQFLVHRDFDAAIEQLRWCLRRKPHEARLRQLLAKAQHERIARREAPAPNIKQR